MKLLNRIAVVTGAASGIGGRAAVRLAGEGAKLFLMDVNPDGLEATRSEILASGGEAIACPCDVSDEAAVKAAVMQAMDAYGRIDILVNNAGITRDSLSMTMKEENFDVLGVGKIEDIFCHRGLAESDHAAGNPACVDATLKAMDKDASGLIFVNLVDFDSVYGHRRDVKGYAEGLEYFDSRLPEIQAKMTDDDLLILTADHGCDPTYTGTDHTREYVPILVWHKGMKGLTDLGTRATYADMAATVAEYLGVPERFNAVSFLEKL